MMRLLYWIFTLSLLAICVAFAVENTQVVDVGLFPLPNRPAMQLWFLWICTLFAGLILGFVVAWVIGSRTRGRAREALRRTRWQETEIRQLEQRASKAEAALAASKKQASEQKTDAPPAGMVAPPSNGAAAQIEAKPT